MTTTDFESPSPGPAGLPPIDLGCIAMTALLMQHAELRMGMGLDPDGSQTIGRFLAILGGYGQLSRAIDIAAGMPWDPQAALARGQLRSLVLRSEPVLTRWARPDLRR